MNSITVTLANGTSTKRINLPPTWTLNLATDIGIRTVWSTHNRLRDSESNEQTFVWTLLLWVQCPHNTSELLCVIHCYGRRTVSSEIFLPGKQGSGWSSDSISGFTRRKENYNIFSSVGPPSVGLKIRVSLTPTHSNTRLTDDTNPR